MSGARRRPVNPHLVSFRRHSFRRAGWKCPQSTGRTTITIGVCCALRGQFWPWLSATGDSLATAVLQREVEGGSLPHTPFGPHPAPTTTDYARNGSQPYASTLELALAVQALKRAE